MIRVTMSGDENFDTSFLESLRIITEPYSGTYEATSLVANDYELATNGKRMTDNITVKKIPYEAVSNPQGGYTVTIGGN